MHSMTLWCTRQTQVAGGVAFSGQVIINVSVLVLLMIQMMFTERTLFAVMPIVFMALSVLVGTGVFLWNAGDVTIEASRLPAAMFHSGWHNCTKQSSVRVRKLVTIAIAQAQNTDRTLTHLLATAATFVSMMFSTGVIMWNAGDITVEAGNLPTAIFLSGWQNCTNMSSYRIRRLVLIAIAQSQKPVIIKCCGFMDSLINRIYRL
ncbi:uncharacterized protein LOC125242706 [Leguminivora glycinivorella]|uniref:uncharacterized protein LOC125242706 n=1 Tax=Leguminivora glycinivorella TaxID=1035111 RepID=UPI00200D6B67|nr:uncharacterized protein LOC125242706 [Leguminivora glycinivorella]